MKVVFFGMRLKKYKGLFEEYNEKGVSIVLGLEAFKKKEIIISRNSLGYYLSPSGESGDSESERVIRAMTSFFSTIFLAVSGNLYDVKCPSSINLRIIEDELYPRR